STSNKNNSIAEIVFFKYFINLCKTEKPGQRNVVGKTWRGSSRSAFAAINGYKIWSFSSFLHYFRKLFPFTHAAYCRFYSNGQTSSFSNIFNKINQTLYALKSGMAWRRKHIFA